VSKRLKHCLFWVRVSVSAMVSVSAAGCVKAGLRVRVRFYVRIMHPNKLNTALVLMKQLFICPTLVRVKVF
jgi:hypothetical protein